MQPRCFQPIATAWSAGSRQKAMAIRPTMITIATPTISAHFALTIDEPIDWTRFGIWLTMLLHRHGEALLRVKGILNVADAATPVAVHGVQHLVHPPRHLAAWPDADRRSRLVFIARGLDPAVIRRSFRAFSMSRKQNGG